MAPSLRTLRNIAVLGGFVALGSAGYFTVKIQNKFRDADYYKKSLTLLRNYAPIENSIGRPISGSSIDLGDFENNQVDGMNAKIAIPVSGPKGKGTLYCFASRLTIKDSWQIDQLDIETQKNKQRWTFYRLPKPESDSPPEVESDSPPKPESDSPPELESDSPPKPESDSPPEVESDSPPKPESDSPPELESDSPLKPESGSPET